MTRLSRMIATLLVLMAAMAVQAQGWSEFYDQALNAAKSGKWLEARDLFKKAAALRTEDVSAPTILPGSITDPRRWRGGAPYSPNFGAAYAGLRAALEAKEDGKRTELLRTSATEFEALLAKNQNSRETFYFLNAAYARVRDLEKQRKLEDRVKAVDGKFTWRVDTEFVAPEELAAIQQASGVATQPIQQPTNPQVQPTIPINPGSPTVVPGNPPLTTNLVGRVPALANKYALIIGNSEGRLPDLAVPFAASDAMAIRESLVVNGGYAEENIDLIQNATASQILRGAQALAERIPDGATIFVWFSGIGANLDGKDFLAGVDTESTLDSSTMVSKMDIYRIFMAKGARIFSFFQVNRPIVAGRHFGMEVPMVGSISQMQATIPGDGVLGYVRNSVSVGLFTDAIVATMAKYRSNRVPISDFAWDVFYRMRSSDTGVSDGASQQTCTLPVLINMASDARF